ncbi:2-hydroxyacid dehydrogenase [Pedobacter sp. BS3]|uniref:2-hydroxyacid dehydrogenase n=1 Tax=Pedobacter sp. BS3 TaxID=2567937 RepID=UPI0011EE852D|nr:2-hydroxyacid dehydrogenase [Pedobacter sp. BS3]TZF82154.1 2-hydroxyacid dehydrogenase [Pedobacter sp. BS3]
MKTLFFSTKSYDKLYFDRVNVHYNQVLDYTETALDATTAVLANGYDAVCTFVNDAIDEAVLHALKKAGIKVIALRCAGFNQVNLDEAKKLNIAVVRVPAYSPHAIAEHALALIMTLNRKTHKAYNRVREGNFSLERLTGFDIYGKTLGIVGLGKIGHAFAEVMSGFGCKLIAYDPVATTAPGRVLLVSFDELLAQSDIISVHCPLTPETHHLFNDDSFAKMKQSAMLINTSRGAVVDTDAAIRALKSGKLGYLGLDVYEQEEKLFFRDLSESVIQDDLLLRLMSFPNVLITSHQGFFTAEALMEIAHVTLQNLSDIENNVTNANRLT